MVNILLTISYDGTNYSGWQRQKNAVTVQEAIEKTLSGLFCENIAVTGSSRTDAGVHALGQRATFRVDNLKIPFAKLPLVINSHLPMDISVTHAEIVEESFHPRFRAKEKTYEYKIFNAANRNPILRNYCHFVPVELNYERMAEASKYFVGTYDFSAFCAAGTKVTNFERTVYSLDMQKQGEIISFRITGNGFLYNMIRIIAGTLIDVGKGRFSPEDITGIILSRKREFAGKTADANGLTLLNIKF